MSVTHESRTGGPTLPQERRLVTPIPGPRSRELQERRTASVAAGVSSVLPVYVAAAGGGVLVDVDGNSLIDLASGIAITSVGNALSMRSLGIVRASSTCSTPSAFRSRL